MSDAVRQELASLGYDVGVAWGDAAVEEDALEVAREEAGEARVQADAEPIIVDALAKFVTLTADDARVGPTQIADFLGRVTAQTFRQIRAGRDARVEHLERAVEVAGDLPTVYSVAGYGLALYSTLDEEHVEREEGGRPTDTDGVVHPLIASHKARRFLHVLGGSEEPGDAARASAAFATLRAKGYRLDCDIEDDGSGFAVGILAGGAVIEIAADADELEQHAEQLPPVDE